MKSGHSYPNTKVLSVKCEINVTIMDTMTEGGGGSKTLKKPQSLFADGPQTEVRSKRILFLPPKAP